MAPGRPVLSGLEKMRLRRIANAWFAFTVQVMLASSDGRGAHGLTIGQHRPKRTAFALPHAGHALVRTVVLLRLKVECVQPPLCALTSKAACLSLEEPRVLVQRIEHEAPFVGNLTSTGTTRVDTDNLREQLNVAVQAEGSAVLPSHDPKDFQEPLCQPSLLFCDAFEFDRIVGPANGPAIGPAIPWLCFWHQVCRGELGKL